MIERLQFRLHNDFQLAIVLLFGASAMLGITPFAVYRLLTGSLLIGVVDFVIVGCIAGAVVHAWRTGRTRPAAIFLVVCNTVGCIVVSALIGLPGLLWMYPTLLANYFLVERGQAVIASAIGLVAVTLQGKGFVSDLHTVLFLVTASLVSLFAFIFASRTESQRRRLEELATRDPLTGAQNRRAMQQELQIAIERRRRDGSPAAVLMLDLDHFKRINDRHGHDSGDRVLVAFAELVQRSTRQVDRFFRYGGEEFVLLLSPASTAAMRKVADALCARVAAELRCRDEAVTVSIGGAGLDPDDDAGTWLARADAALYRAKQDGRNRAVIDDAVPAPTAAAAE